MKVKDYINYRFESSCYRTEEYIKFERQCRKELKSMLTERGINLHKFLPNHFEWSAVLEKGGKFVYVRISDVRCFSWYNEVLIRTMAHDRDWTGGTNNYCSFDKIGYYADNLFSKM
jgi:hypothetical protein